MKLNRNKYLSLIVIAVIILLILLYRLENKQKTTPANKAIDTSTITTEDTSTILHN